MLAWPVFFSTNGLENYCHNLVAQHISLFRFSTFLFFYANLCIHGPWYGFGPNQMGLREMGRWATGHWLIKVWWICFWSCCHLDHGNFLLTRSLIFCLCVTLTLWTQVTATPAVNHRGHHHTCWASLAHRLYISSKVEIMRKMWKNGKTWLKGKFLMIWLIYNKQKNW